MDVHRMLAELTDEGVVILDGGLSNALEDGGADLSSELWTARLLSDAPQDIAAVHRAYFEAGAQVATTASYQASVPSLVAAGLSAAAAEALITASVTVARDVRDEMAEALPQTEGGRPLLVAASVGPYGAVLADGSEYRGRYGLTQAQLRDFHLPRLEILAAAGPDLLAVETIPDLEEAEALVPLLDEIGIPAWFCYSVHGSATRAGQPLEDAYAVLRDSKAIEAVGVNCSAPHDVVEAVRIATSVTGLPSVAYPNKGEDWDSATNTWRGTGEYAADLATDWVASGARLVGGCCRVGPEEIAGLAEQLSPRR